MRSLFRRSLALMLSILMLLSFTGCGGSATINGISLNKFSIVYSDDQPDYTLRAAQYIQSEILERTGVELPICEDDTGTYDHEILVGNTNRTLSSAMRSESATLEFFLTADKNHIALNGEYFLIAAAAYYFVETYITGDRFQSTIPADEVITAQPIQESPNHFLFLIGDGMGFNHTLLFSYLDSDSLEEPGDGEDIFYGYYLPYQGQVRTDSLSGTTDSAAGATALACGYKTFNSHVGRDQEQNDVQNLTELAISLGMATAVLSTDTQNGATPAGFSAHANDRDDSDRILKCQQNLFLNHGTIFRGGLSSTQSCQNTVTEVLAQLDESDRFFLMYEEGHIDKRCHAQDSRGAFGAMVRFNQVIGLFMEYAFYHPDTLLLITADHETGDLHFENGQPVCPIGEHTGADVPIFAYGQGAEVFDGFHDENNLIPQHIAALWGIEDFGE